MNIRPKESCRYDVISLGEVMLRLDPGEGRIRTARHFRAWEGGGEYNVARGLRRCFGQRAAMAAKKYGTLVSYDLNYRPSLWKGFGGLEKCREINREIARHVDVMIGNEEDFTACLGFEVEGVDSNLTDLDTSSFEKMIARAVADFPNFLATATTLRGVKSATVNDWGAMCWFKGSFHKATHRPNLEILDRVGGGDSFASGFIYGLMELGDPQAAVEYGAAHGALAMTTPGDTTMASLAEVKKLAGGGGARVDR